MRTLRQILGAEPTLGRWLDRHARESAVLQLVQRALPPALAAHVVAADTGSQQLLLAATSGAAAALLRQRVPALLLSLERGGWQFSGIQIRVQPRSAVRRWAKSVPKQIDARSATRLRARASALGDPALREALLRLAGQAARGSGEEQPPHGVHEERDDQQQQRVFDDPADEDEIAPVAPKEIQDRRNRDGGQRDRQ